MVETEAETMKVTGKWQVANASLILLAEARTGVAKWVGVGVKQEATRLIN